MEFWSSESLCCEKRKDVRSCMYIQRFGNEYVRARCLERCTWQPIGTGDCSIPICVVLWVCVVVRLTSVVLFYFTPDVGLVKCFRLLHFFLINTGILKDNDYNNRPQTCRGGPLFRGRSLKPGSKHHGTEVVFVGSTFANISKRVFFLWSKQPIESVFRWYK